MIMKKELSLRLSELKEGINLPIIKRLVTQEKINLYAEASRDFNPIHIDEKFARKTSLGGTIAHGMLILAYVAEMMGTAFGSSWLVGSKLNVRFKNPVHPGDIITVSGHISHLNKDAGRTSIHCDILCQNQNDEPIITGETSLRV